MKPFRSPLLPLIVLATCVCLPAAGTRAAAPPILSKVVALSGHGGASVNAPDWKTSRSDDAVTILERTVAGSRGAFTTLVLAVEEGPSKVQVIDWQAVRDNILGAAKGAGSNLTLTLGGSWSRAAGFEGQRLKGMMRSGERDVAVEMIALIAPGIMVTITTLGPPGDTTLAPLVDAVARTASRPTSSP